MWIINISGQYNFIATIYLKDLLIRKELLGSHNGTKYDHKYT